jgi:hypothetical protein
MANINFPIQYSHLTKNNYENWCIHVKAWLGSRYVLETIEKDFEEPIKKRNVVFSPKGGYTKGAKKGSISTHTHLTISG